MDMETESTKRQKIEGIENLPYQLHNARGMCSVSAGKGIQDNKVMLFEVQPDMLARIKAGEKLRVVGSKSKDAVICGQNMTYSIKKVETSNSVFVVPPSSSNHFEIMSKCDQYFEFCPIRGKVDQIFEILSPTKYTNSTDVYPSEILFTRTQLDAIIAASSEEIDQALKNMHIVEVGPQKHLRMLDRTLINESARLILDTLIENAWPIDAVNEGDIYIELPDSDRVFTTHVLQCLGESVKDGVWRLSGEKIAIATADMLFRYREDNSKPWPADDFLLTWAARTPGQENPSELLLRGIAVKDEIQKGHSSIMVFIYLSAEDLPLDVKARFSAIFEKKSKFSVVELEPYFAGYYGGLGQPKTFVELALQHARLIDNFYYLK